MQGSGRLFVVAAPSGAGKTTLCKALLARLGQEGGKPLRWSTSYTTRRRREAEVEGQDYFFVDDQAFDRMVAESEFAEWAHVHEKRYGTGKLYLEQAAKKGDDLLVEIDIQGAKSLRGHYPDACFIFVLPPSWRALEARLRGRGTEADGEIAVRLARAQEEMLEWSWFDYVIINDDFEVAVDHLRSVVLASRSHRDIMKEAVDRVLESLNLKE